MKKILLLVIGIVVLSVVGIKASELISSNQVIYKDNETVDVALNNLFDELKVGKEKVAAAITAKGVETTEDNTLEGMASNIDSIEKGTKIKYYIKDGVLQGDLIGKAPSAYTNANNGQTINGSYYTYVGTSNSGYYFEISNIDVTNINKLYIGMTTASSSQGYWYLYDESGNLINQSSTKSSYVDVSTVTGLCKLRFMYGQVNIYDMFGI